MIYEDYITSAHRKRPKFTKTVALGCELCKEVQDLLVDMQQKFVFSKGVDDDERSAVGDQLDAIGRRVGVTRVLRREIEGFFFKFNEEGVETPDDPDDELSPTHLEYPEGWNAGQWKEVLQDTTSIFKMSDDDFFVYCRTKIASNQWLGTIREMRVAWRGMFPPIKTFILVIDHQNMSIDLQVVGSIVSPIFKELVVQGMIPFKPAGVQMNLVFIEKPHIIFQFGWNLEIDYPDFINGWNLANWLYKVE